jgi:predicted TIM-barrel fold metal-dependent hydrolase
VPSTFAVFDAHQHIGPVPGWDPTAPAPVVADVEARLAIMDRFGIGRACLMPSHVAERTDALAVNRSLNDRVAAARAACSERFPVALGTVDLWLGPQAIADETERALDELGLDGLSWHHRLSGLYIDDPRMHPVLERLAERRKVAAVHVFAESTFEMPWRLEELAEAHRDVRFVAMDAFSSYDRSCWMHRLARVHPNLWFDTAALAGNANTVASFVKAAGPDRLMLGTNLYGAQMTDFLPVPLLVIEASHELDDAAKRSILGGAAEALYGLAPARSLPSPR